MGIMSWMHMQHIKDVGLRRVPDIGSVYSRRVTELASSVRSIINKYNH